MLFIELKRWQPLYFAFQCMPKIIWPEHINSLRWVATSLSWNPFRNLLCWSRTRHQQKPTSALSLWPVARGLGLISSSLYFQMIPHFTIQYISIYVIAVHEGVLALIVEHERHKLIFYLEVKTTLSSTGLLHDHVLMVKSFR